MKCFCCSRRRPAIFVDVDDTLFSSGDESWNSDLLEALRGKSIVFLTSMSMREVQERATNPNYLTRKSIIDILKSGYNIMVVNVLTPVDLHEELVAGEGYERYMKTWVTAVEQNELTEHTLETHAGYQEAAQEFYRRYDQVNEALHLADPKGRLVEKFLAQAENQHFNEVYFFDDKLSCIASVKESCYKLEMPLVAFQVNMRAERQDYQAALRSTARIPEIQQQARERSPLLPQ